MQLTPTEVDLCERVLAVDDWQATAKFLAQPAIADWLIKRSLETPYTHLEGYMERYWLLNPCDFSAPKSRALPSVRIHHILRRDLDRHFHDHPWPARTIILRGWYVEERLLVDGSTETTTRAAGDTAELNYGEYHRITDVSCGGVWTLFITHQYQGTWGFLVDGKKVPWRQYLGLEPAAPGTPSTTAVAGA